MSMHWYVLFVLTMTLKRVALLSGQQSWKTRYKFTLIIDCFILQDQERRTPLHAAACVGDVHIMDLLIESGEWAVCITLMRIKNLAVLC